MWRVPLRVAGGSRRDAARSGGGTGSRGPIAARNTAPRRHRLGFNRLAMVLAVLEARCGVVLSGSDIFLNIAGGIRISEPAADLAVAAALLSSQSNIPVPGNTVFFGEVGLAGEIRAVSQPDVRLKAASSVLIVPRFPKRPSKRARHLRLSMACGWKK